MVSCNWHFAQGGDQPPALFIQPLFVRSQQQQLLSKHHSGSAPLEVTKYNHC
jgi:hypothetical protein